MARPGWSLQATLTRLNGPVGGDFGTAVALDGDTALIGAPWEDGACGDNCGSAYIFTRSGSTWTQQARFVPSSSNDWTEFGHSVALDGNTALIGAWGEDCTYVVIDCGTAYVFTRSGSTWSYQDKFSADDAELIDRFGSAVALSGEMALIGAYNDDCPNGWSWCGSVYIFTRSGSSWSQQAILRPNDPASDKHFGSAIALDGDTLVIGAPGEGNCSVGYGDCGSAYIFKQGSGSAWTQTAKLKLSDGVGGDGYVPGDRFGSSVAVSGYTVLVGARNRKVSGCFGSCGAAYVYILAPDQALVASAVCNGPNLDVTISSGDGLFDITASAGINLPVLDVNVGTTTINGPEKWDDLTITESNGDLESLKLGQFRCRSTERPVPVWPAHLSHITNTYPLFSWTAMTDANNYRIFVFDNGNPSTRTVDIRQNSGGSTSMQLAVPLPNGRLFWRVRGRQNRIWSLWSIRFTLFIDPPVLFDVPAVEPTISTLPLVVENPLKVVPVPTNHPSSDGSAPPERDLPPTLPAPPNSG